tara:strand:- start:2164 stop:2391 length:228 start_codon:yes stop_codon:yes gene_type:complete
MNEYNDEEELERLHEIETPGAPNNIEEGLNDTTLLYLNQIKKCQEELEKLMLEVQEKEMAILGYSHALQDSLQAK